MNHTPLRPVVGIHHDKAEGATHPFQGRTCEPRAPHGLGPHANGITVGEKSRVCLALPDSEPSAKVSVKSTSPPLPTFRLQWPSSAHAKPNR